MGLSDYQNTLELLGQEAARAAQHRCLTSLQLEIIYSHKWFNLFVPKQYGGLELSLPDALAVEEALAEVDGSLGWTITLCAGAAWFVGFLNPEVAQEVFADPKVCLGGSGASTGKAVQKSKGFEISGQWRFATGAPHLKYFTANCQLQDEAGQPMLHADGSPKIKAFIFKREEVKILEDWRAMGLEATASHTFSTDKLWVPANRAFELNVAAVQMPQPVFQYPFIPFAAATLAVNYCGMARHFLRLTKDIFKPKNDTQLMNLLKNAVQEIEAARSEFYVVVNESWEHVAAHQPISEAQIKIVNQSSAQLADLCIKKVDVLFPYCGMTGADTATEINRVWRDLHTASQHGLLRQLLPL